MAAAEREAERKYLTPPGWALPRLPGLGEWTPPRRHQLYAEYYDTPDYDLTRAGWVLRRRTGGTDAGWHLKRPVAADVRVEERRDEASELPGDFRTAVTDLAGAKPLLPVAVLTTARTERDLVAHGRVRAHLAEDEVTSVVAGVEASWAEVEVELVPDEPLATLDAVGAALLGSGCTPAPHGSKMARALADAVAAPRLEPGPDAPAADIVLPYAAKQVGVLQALADPVRVDAPDSVHKSRVACRRLRSLLRTYGPLFEADAAAALTDELRWYGEVAGAPRDAEVLKEHLLAAVESLEADAVHGPVLERLVADLDALHAGTHARLVEAMATERYVALRRALEEFLLAPPLTPAGLAPGSEQLPGLLAAAVKRVEKRYRRARKHSGHLEHWHETRKAAKAARYCAEALVDVHGDPAKEYAALFEAVTEALGEVQDTVVVHETLGLLADEASDCGEPTDTYAVLQDRQLDKRADSLEAAHDALDAALAADRDWLG